MSQSFAVQEYAFKRPRHSTVRHPSISIYTITVTPDARATHAFDANLDSRDIYFNGAFLLVHHTCAYHEPVLV